MSIVSFASHWESFAPKFLSFLRILAAALFITFGTMKLFSFPVGMPPGTPPISLLSLVGIAGLLEVIGGGLMLLGLFTRPVAFILAGEMAIAYFYGHMGLAFWPIMNGGTNAILFCFIWLYISAAGAGPWSLDALRKR